MADDYYDGFYPKRDEMVGGTRNAWNSHATFERANATLGEDTVDLSDMTWQDCTQAGLAGSSMPATPGDDDDVQYSGPSATATVQRDW